MSNKETKIKGEVIDCLSNGRFRVKLESEKEVHSYLAGKMKMHKIRVIIGDKVEMVAPEYGDIFRITRRL